MVNNHEVSKNFEDLLERNRIAAESRGELPPTSQAQMGLAVVTCMDTRIDPLSALGLQLGDAKIIRNAGARVTDDVIRGLAAATAALGVSRVAVVAHTDCKMAAVSQEDLATLVAEANGATADAASSIDYLTTSDQAASVAQDVAAVRTASVLPNGIEVAGFILNLESGRLEPVA